MTRETLFFFLNVRATEIPFLFHFSRENMVVIYELEIRIPFFLSFFFAVRKNILCGAEKNVLHKKNILPSFFSFFFFLKHDYLETILLDIRDKQFSPIILLSRDEYEYLGACRPVFNFSLEINAASSKRSKNDHERRKE